MSLVKYRVKDVATDFGVTPKEITEIISKYFEKPKSNTQVLEDNELNVLFDYLTQHNQITSLEQVFAVQPKKPEPKPEPKKEEPKPEPKKEAAPQQQGSRPAQQQANRPQQPSANAQQQPKKENKP